MYLLPILFLKIFKVVIQTGTWYNWIKHETDRKSGNEEKLWEAKGMVSEQMNTVWSSVVPELPQFWF